MSYVVQFGPWSIDHSGDTMLYDGMIERLRLWQVNVALLPMNGDDPARRVAGNLSGPSQRGWHMISAYAWSFHVTTTCSRSILRRRSLLWRPVLRSDSHATYWQMAKAGAVRHSTHLADRSARWLHFREIAKRGPILCRLRLNPAFSCILLGLRNLCLHRLIRTITYGKRAFVPNCACRPGESCGIPPQAHA